jgi:hypothetical protein
MLCLVVAMVEAEWLVPLACRTLFTSNGIKMVKNLIENDMNGMLI